MATRRSSRAPSVKPASVAAPTKAAPKPASKAVPKSTAKAKPASKATAASTSKTGTKRAASPENDPPPPSKRAKPTSKPAVNGDVSKTKPKTTAKKLDAIAEDAPLQKAPRTRKPRPHFNDLPTPADHTRPTAQLFVWGAGNFGQFAMGVDALGEFDKPRRNTWVEKKIEEGAFGGEDCGFEAVAAGGLHSLFIDEKGTVWSSGCNDDAALGRPTTNVPNPEKEGEFIDVDTLSAQPWSLQSLVDEKFRAVRIAAGDNISAALSDTGDLRVWGSFRGVEGLLGFADGQKYQHIPANILDIKTKPGDEEKFTSVVAGNNHLVVMTTHGNLYTWGAGEQGQLGRKVLERRKIHGTVPEKIILGSRNRKAVVVGAGSYTSFAVDDKGDVWGWGLNNMGQTGTGYSASQVEVQVPKRVIGLSKADLGGEDHVVEIAGGEHHTLFLTASGKVYACGRADGGQVGISKEDKAFEDADDKDMLTEPALVTFPGDDDDEDPIVHVSAGIHNNLAVSKDGALFCWGTGPQGELGAGDDTEVKTPKMIVRREGGSWAAIAADCGGQHSLGLFRKKTS